MITSAVAGVQNATVAFTAPAEDGGTPVFAYTATCRSANGLLTASRSGKASPLVVGAMSVGAPYTCRVAARNAVGLGAFSAASGVVVPLLSIRRARPGAPIDVQAIAAIDGIQIDFLLAPEPPHTRGVTESRGKCESSDGGIRGERRVHRVALIVGLLTPGKAYRCEVQVSNGNGFGPYSALSNSVVPLPPLPKLGAPTITSVTAGLAQVSVAFNEPVHEGGQPIVHYRATCVSVDGGATNARTGVTSPIVVLGLTGGKTYTCKVIAHTHAADGPPSAPSASVVTLAE
jgi:hypothetical protein